MKEFIVSQENSWRERERERVLKRVREMKRDHRGPRLEGFDVFSNVSEKVLKIDKWMKREIEPFTLVLRDKIHHH